MYYRLAFIIMLSIASPAIAQEQKPLLLYPEGVPNSKKAPADYKETIDVYNISKVTDPTLTPFFPPKGKATGTAVIVCPGGGYAFLASGHEGRDVAMAFNKVGITAFVLKYRLPSDVIMTDRTIGPLQDAQRAIQIVRERAAEWNINPGKVGIIGFSAGGHLASTAGTHFAKTVINNPNNISVRPDFMMLIYPVITMGPFTHPGSKENLIGKNAPQELIDLYSNEKQVTPVTPITFIVQAEDDNVVPVQNAVMFYEALLNAKVKSEMHLYQGGGHGYGLNNSTTQDMWFDRGVNWLKANGF